MDISWSAFLLKIGALAGNYVVPHIFNNYTFRNLRKKWFRDNYRQKTVLMFKAAIDDAKNAVGLPDNLAIALLDDPMNRDEIFSWILTATPDTADLKKLNVEPYIEMYHGYEDLIRPFFDCIALSLDEQKKITWDPEFLQVIYGIEQLSTSISEILHKQNQHQEANDRMMQMLQSIATPVEFEDLKQLIEQGKIIKAREIAFERLKSKGISRDVISELHLIIADTYIQQRRFNDSVQHLYVASSNIDDTSKCQRYLALIDLFQNRLDMAEEKIRAAISLSNDEHANTDVLVSILLAQEKFEETFKVFEKIKNRRHDQTKAHAFYFTNQYEEIIQLSNVNLDKNPNNVDWLLWKIEASILLAEEGLKEPQSSFYHDLGAELNPIFDHLEYLVKENQNTYVINKIIEMKAAMFYISGKFVEAKSLYTQLFNNEQNYESHIFNNLLLSASLSQEWQSVVHLLENKTTENTLKPEEVLCLVDGYIHLTNPEKSLAILKENNYLSNSSDFNIQFGISYIDSLFLELRHKEIIEYLKTVSFEWLKNLLEAYYAYKKREWDIAIVGFESYLLNSEQFNSKDVAFIKMLLAKAYTSVTGKRNQKKTIEMIPSIPYWKRNISLVNIYINSLYQLNMYKSAIDFSKEIQIDSIIVKEVLASIYYNTKSYKLAKEVYLSLHQLTGKLSFQLSYANCLYLLGDLEGCLKILSAAEIEVKRNGNVRDYQLISVAYKEAKEYKRAMEFAYLAFKKGENDPEIWSFYFNQFLLINNHIQNLNQKWIDAYQNVMRNFKRKFPYQKPLFETIPILGQVSNSDDTSSRFEPLMVKLKEIHDEIEETSFNFNKFKLPIRFLVEHLKRPPFVTWLYVMKNRELYIGLNDFSFKNQSSDFKNETQSFNVLCDFSTLLTIKSLGLLEKLNSRFSLFIEQEEFDVALQEVYDNILSEDKGKQSIYYRDGKISLSESSPEEVRNERQQQEHFLNWIKENCEFVGSVIKDEKADNSTFMDNTLEICRQNSFVLLIDSFAMKIIARNSYDVETLSSYEFLILLFEEKQLNSEESIEALIKLLITGHTILPLNNYVFKMVLKNKNFDLDTELISFISYLKNKEINERYVIELISEILFWLWGQLIFIDQKKSLTSEICKTLYEREDNDEIIKQLIEQCDSRSSQNPVFRAHFSTFKKVLSSSIITKNT